MAVPHDYFGDLPTDALSSVEKGTALYFRVTAVLLAQKLNDLKAVTQPDAYVAAFSKLVASVVTLSQIDNPAIRAESVSQARLNRRQAVTTSKKHAYCWRTEA